MSSTKRTIEPVVLVNGTALTGSFQSQPFSIKNYDRLTIEILCTGAPVGTVTVQASNDYVPPSMSLNPSVIPADWFDMPLGLVALTGSAQNYFIDVAETGIPWIRINYVYASGTGSMTAVVTAKES